MENIFKIVERKINHCEEHKYNYNKPFRGIIYWKRI